MNSRGRYKEREDKVLLELLDGRPENTEGRLEKEIRVYDFLDHLGIEYKRVDHEPAFTMEVCEEIDKMLQATICKNLFLCNRQKTQFYLLMMPGDKPFKTKEITYGLVFSLLYASPVRTTFVISCPTASRYDPNTSAVRIRRLDVFTHG